MNNKLPLLMLSVILGIQPVSACELCGHKNAEHGMAFQAVATLAFFLRSFSDTYGWNTFRNNQLEGGYIEGQENPLILIPHQETLLERLESVAADGRILLVVESAFLNEVGGEPQPVDGFHYYGTENPVQYRLLVALYARTLLNDNFENLESIQGEFDLKAILTTLFDEIRSFTEPDSINAEPQLGSEEYGEGYATFVDHWTQRLDALLPSLWNDYDALPDVFRFSEDNYSYLQQDPQLLELSIVSKIIHEWRNACIAHRLKLLHRQARAKQIPLVLLFINKRLRHFQACLDAEDVTHTSDLSTLSRVLKIDTE